jgi:hypothetical protein
MGLILIIWLTCGVIGSIIWNIAELDLIVWIKEDSVTVNVLSILLMILYPIIIGPIGLLMGLLIWLY